MDHVWHMLTIFGTFQFAKVGSRGIGFDPRPFRCDNTWSKVGVEVHSRQRKQQSNCSYNFEMTIHRFWQFVSFRLNYIVLKWGIDHKVRNQ